METKQERDLSELYQSIDDPKILEDRKSYELAINAFADKWGSDVRYTQDPEVLSQALEAYEKIGDMYDEYHYISLLATKYTQDKTISARYNQTMEFVVKMMNKLEFFLINIGHIPQEKQAEFLNHP